MTTKEMYEILKDLKDHTDWNDLESVRNYNRVARDLRHIVYESEERRADHV